MAAKRQPVIDYGFDPFATIRQLKTHNLLIHTIPDEEWTLSCHVHKTLLVDVYTLRGTIAKYKQPQIYQCGRLGEIFVKLLRIGRKVQYQRHGDQVKDEKVTKFTSHQMLAETFEEDFIIRLRGGDIVFRLIPGESWRLTNTDFGQWMNSHTNFFYLAEEHTLGTPNVRMYKDNRIDHLLLEFLCQNATFVPKTTESKVLEFKHD